MPNSQELLATEAGVRTWNVRRTGAGVPVNWKGYAWNMRMNWDGLNSDRRLRVRQGMEDIVPRIGSGGEVVGQTDEMPNSGQEAYELFGPGAVIVYARPFDEGGATALAFSDQFYANGRYLGAIVLFNTMQWGHPYMNTLSKFKTVAWHELGHAAGLLHCSATNQVMNANITKQLPWGGGDLTGFSVLKAAR
jgi:hypothetical protein